MPLEPTSLTVSRIQPAYHQVSTQLRTLITGGGLAPDERLPPEPELATADGGSRGTVREAVRILSSEGLVRTERGVNGGTFVARIDAEDVTSYLESRLGILIATDSVTNEHLAEARMLIEVPCARVAALRRTEDDLAALRELVDRERDAALTAWTRGEHSHEFHRRILHIGANPVIQIMLEPVLAVSRAHQLTSQDSDSLTAAHADHDAILRSVAAGDADGAARAMADHLGLVERMLERGFTAE